MWITDRVYRFDSAKRGNAYLFKKSGSDYCVIDTGLPGEGKEILKEIGNLGIGPEEVSAILLTHSDLDHIGNTAMLKEGLKAPVMAPEKERDYLSGKRTKKFHGNKKILAAVMKRAVKVTPFDVDSWFKEGDTVCSLRVFESPGHTEGSVCFHSPEYSLLFSGDALLCTPEGGIAGFNTGFTEDHKTAGETLRKISGLEFETLLPGHGIPAVYGAQGMLKEFLAEN